MVGDGRFAACTPRYHQGVVERLRQQPGALYSDQERAWTFPLPLAGQVQSALESGSYQQVRVEVAALHPAAVRILRAAEAAAASDESHRYSLLPLDLEERLLPFQRDGVRFALQRGGRVLIGDEMVGTGRIRLLAPALD